MTSDTAGGEPRLRLRAPSDILATIPFVVGYHPRDSMVVLGMDGRELVFSARNDLPPQGAGRDVCADCIQHLLDVVLAQDCTGVLIVGFGPHDRVYPMASALADEYDQAGLAVLEVLRSDEGRYWSYLCRNPRCCPPEGTPYDPAATAVAAEWTLTGRVVLPDREEFERQVRPVTGEARDAMRAATVSAHERLIDLLATPPTEAEVQAALLDAGRAAIAAALAHQRAGRRLDDDEVAWLTVLLDAIPVRDEAWLQVDGDEDELRLHRALWMDVVRRTEPDLVPAPGCLLGFVAWRLGEGGLARLALDRVLDEDPSYVMAGLLHEALCHGISPSVLDDLRAPATTRRLARRRRRRSSSRRAGSRRG